MPVLIDLLLLYGDGIITPMLVTVPTTTAFVYDSFEE